MPLADKYIVSEIIYIGSTLGTFNATITNATDIVIPISAWDNYARDISLGGMSATTLLAEWLSISVQFNIPVGSTATTVYFWLAGSQAPEAITPICTKSIANAPVTIAYSFNALSSSIDIMGTNSVRLRGYVDAGTVEIKMITLSYSPK